MTYAADTRVSVERSRAEIERTLVRYGATKFASFWDQDKSMIQFQIVDRHIRFTLPLPMREDYTHTPMGKTRTVDSAEVAWEKACRARWRALLLIIKAKLEAVESGIVMFEEEFMAHIVLPNGTTVGEHMLPQIEIAYDKGNMPKMLPGA